MSEAAQIFEDAIRWLRDTYDNQSYFVERDIVYTMQLHLWELVRERGGLLIASGYYSKG